MHNCLPLILLGMLVMQTPNLGAQETMGAKQAAIAHLRQRYANQAYRGHSLRGTEPLEKCLSLLGEDGQFEDLRAGYDECRTKKLGQSRYSGPQGKVSALNQKALNRFWRIAEAFRGDRKPEGDADAIRRRLYRGVIHYGTYELGRANVSGGRFHPSCFAMPTAAINTYFCLFDEMKAVENGTDTDPLAVEMNRVVKEVGFQSWTQPYRNDETDRNVVQVARFQKHVWWVGGNGLAYRSVLPCAAMMSSVPMVDVLAKVAKGGLSNTSQTTYEDAFWTEGFTADGAGWGHGMQCLIWGYPVHGTSAALDLLNTLKGTPWAQQLDRSNLDAILNFVRGSAFYHHRGFVPPCLGRGNMNWEPKPGGIPSARLADNLLRNWRDSLSDSEVAELEQFAQEAAEHHVTMRGQPGGHYTGTRYFFNNDDLVRKTPDYYLMVNMASKRVDGIESAHSMAASFNYYTCDGLTLFQRSGAEYRHAIGAWDLTAWPGVTARQGEEQLRPITNWRGFCSRHSFAAGATHGGENACAGFIFEKLNASNKKGTNDRAGYGSKDAILYGVKAHKGYFLLGDTLVALGAGITNLTPETKGPIWTTIDQTLQHADLRVGGVVLPLDGKRRESIIKAAGAPSAGPVLNNGFLYAILPDQTPANVRILTERRPTRWDMLSPGNKKRKGKPGELDILQLVIDHGETPENDTYGYVVGLNGKLPDEPPVVLSNTPRLQAVSNADGTVVQGVFYHSGSVLKAGDFTYKVSSPCAFMAEWNGERCTFTVTDARMDADLAEIQVRVTRRDVARTVGIPMPQGARCGSPASRTTQFALR